MDITGGREVRKMSLEFGRGQKSTSKKTIRLGGILPK
jgi:hypothetical protein